VVVMQKIGLAFGKLTMLHAYCLSTRAFLWIGMAMLFLPARGSWERGDALIRFGLQSRYAKRIFHGAETLSFDPGDRSRGTGVSICGNDD
jgi:hypothetical protein